MCGTENAIRMQKMFSNEDLMHKLDRLFLGGTLSDHDNDTPDKLI